jgi:hypothetical protein
MSETISVGVVGPSHWAYTATVMAECLDEIVKAKNVIPNEIPRGIFLDAKDFFQLVRQATRDTIADNPPASINAYAIATDVVYSVSATPSNQEQLDTILEEYADLVEELEKPHKLSGTEIEKLIPLKEFFERLAQEGENEMYEQTISLELPSTIGHRIF